MIYKINYIPDIRNIGSYIHGVGKVVFKTADVMKYYVPNKTEKAKEVTKLNIKEQDDDIYQIKQEELEENKAVTPQKSIPTVPTSIDIGNLEKTIGKLYLFESTVSIATKDMHLEKLVNEKLTVTQDTDKPKILIFHTHSQEDFVDSRAGNEEDSVIGLGNRLANILYTKYKIKSLHDKGKYDVVKGKLHRDGSYTRAGENIEKILKANPQIEVVIDIHRDGVPESVKLVHDVNKNKTARIMFVNGVCEKMTDGKMQKINNLPNNYISTNMAFSLQMQLAANRMYPGLMRKILIKPYRYSLYMKPKSLLVEVGAQTNTVTEAKNAMEPLAEVLAKVIG